MNEQIGLMTLKKCILWLIPLPTHSHYQGYYMYSRGFQPKPSFAIITGKGDTQDIPQKTWKTSIPRGGYLFPFAGGGGFGIRSG